MVRRQRLWAIGEEKQRLCEDFFSFDKVGDHAVVNRVAEGTPLLIFVR